MKPSPELLALGRALVEKLGLDERNDMLARWMAHDLAAKIHAAEASPANSAVQQACADAILRLWEHRAVYPHEKRPYESLEPILRTLERLDPTDSTPSYFHPHRDLSGEAAAWLKIATDFDATARTLITYVLGVAAEKSGRDASEWAELAGAAGLDAPDARLVRVILRSPGEAEPSAAEIERRRVRLLLQRLAWFQKSAKAVRASLKAELQRLDDDEQS